MLELLLSSYPSVTAVTGPPPTLLYDPVQGKDIIGNNITEVITGTGVTVNASRLLNGHGVKEFATSGNGQVKVNFTTPLNFDNGDWTIEYDSIVDTFPATDKYTNSFYMYSSTANQYIYTPFLVTLVKVYKLNTSKGHTQQVTMITPGDMVRTELTIRARSDG